MKPDAGSGVPIAVSQVDLQQAATAVGSAGKDLAGILGSVMGVGSPRAASLMATDAIATVAFEISQALRLLAAACDDSSTQIAAAAAAYVTTESLTSGRLAAGPRAS